MALDRDTAITYLGHSTLLVETSGGKRLLIDPFLEHNPACPTEWKSAEKLGKLDLILITHIHADHVADLAAVLKLQPDVPVVGIADLDTFVTQRGGTDFRGMNRGGTQEVAGIGITMTFAVHSSTFTEESGVRVSGGEPAGYILHLENGFRIYAAGDTAVFGDMALLKELYQPELALLPIGDHYTMGPKEAAVAIRLLGVKQVLPIHYATFPMLTGTPEALRAELGSDSDVTVYTVKPGETLR